MGLKQKIASSLAVYLTMMSLLFPNSLTAKNEKNRPWYPSIDAFEHYNSGRTHLFDKAKFGGSFSKPNTVTANLAPFTYPSVYNITYLNHKEIFVYGGGYGNVPGSIGAFVAKINPKTLKPIWYHQLADINIVNEWDYPGVMGILHKGHLYVIYGYRLSKLDPDTGRVIATLTLPTGGALFENTVYNGFDATADGVLVMKSIYRQAGCTLQGPDAIVDCPDPTDVPPSILVSVDPDKMKVLDQVTLPTTIFGRVTIGKHKEKSYAYLISNDTYIRYLVNKQGALCFDDSWNPGTLILPGQTTGSTLVVFDDWVVGQTNATPAAQALSVVAVSQSDALRTFSIQPFLGDPIPPLVAAAFSFAAPGGEPAVSWMPSPVSIDPESNIIYAMDALPGEIAALKLGPHGFTTLWKASQTTTESIAIIGSKQKRAIVGTDIPVSQIPGDNTNDFVVWRDAATGAELARSPLLPAITDGSMVQPYYFGNMFYPGRLGAFYELKPQRLKN